MSETVRKLKDRASRLYSSGRLNDALLLYEQVVEQDPEELQCRLKVGDLHRRLNQREEAVEAYLPVARHYAADGLLLKAIAVCKMVLALDGDHGETQSLMAELHAKRRAPRHVGPPVTLRGMGITPPPGGMVVAPPVGNFTMLEFDDDGSSGLELDDGEAPGASAGMWSTLDNGWTDDLPGQRALDADDDELEIDVMPHVDTGASPPAVDPSLVKPKIVQGKPLSEQAQAAVAAAWPVQQTAAPTAPAAWPLPVDAVEAEDLDDEDLGEVQIPLFSELPRNAFIDLLVKMGMWESEPGDVIIKEGDVGDAFYVVASGRVRVSRRGTDGRDITLAYLSDGAFFGEMSVLQQGVRTATVTVEEPAQVFEIRREVLDEVIERYPSVAKVLRNFYRQRLLSTTMATHPVFMPFDAEQRRGLMEMFKSRHVKSGDVLLEQGKKGTGLFILLHGQLEVVRLAPDGQAVTLAHLGAGDMFGEMSLLTNEPTVARVLAVADCFVLRLSKRKFDEVIMTHPQVLELVSEVSAVRASINDALLGAQQSLTGGTVLV
ncbi:MAG: cyclic nucleotide-binding domain-containing protein [Myxococcota bacterium]